MILPKIAKQKMSVLKEKQADLFRTLNIHIPDSIKQLTVEEIKGIVAGLIIEFVIQSGGDASIFVDDEQSLEYEEYII